MKTVVLTGITWDHSRAYPPLVATAQRFEETHPGVQIRWSKRTLHEFGHADLGALAREFDLVVMDHPWIGYALETGAVLPLEERLPNEVQDDLARNCAGPSFNSYVLEGHVVAVPIDGASPFASYRPDLLAAAGVPVPATWQDVVALARKKLVVMPSHPVDVLLNFVGLCVSQGGTVFKEDGRFVDRNTGRMCLEQMRELVSYIPNAAFGWNPIKVYEQMSGCDEWAYCPFAYGYSNYSRPGFARRAITFASLANLASGQPLRGVLGGTGIAISASCREVDIALEYASFVSSPSCQRTIYFLAGGQPAHLAAWTDDEINALAGDFFRNTLRSMQEAWIRPRYNGYIHFQEAAGIPLVRYLREGGVESVLWETLDRIYCESLPPPGPPIEN
jgi:multiple sugar transport system substrate-binding protein